MFLVGVCYVLLSCHELPLDAQEPAQAGSSNIKTAKRINCPPVLVSELASEGASGRLLCQVRGVIHDGIFWTIYE